MRIPLFQWSRKRPKGKWAASNKCMKPCAWLKNNKGSSQIPWSHFFFTHAQTVIGRKVEARNISSKTYEASKCCSSLKMASDHIKMTEAANSNKIQNQNAPKPHTALQFNSSIMHKMGKYSGSGIWRSIFMEASRKYSQQPFSIESIHY